MGRVGTGKSYFAGCIANALMEQEVPVCMTNFAAILNDLAASFAGRNEMCSPLCFTGENLRKAAAQGKMERLKRLLAGKEICL